MSLRARLDQLAPAAPFAAAAIAAGLAAVSGLLAVQLALAPGDAAFPILPFADVYDARAQTAADPALARSLSYKALSIKAADAQAWLRLAKIQAAADGRLGPKAAQLLARSYVVAPYDPQVLLERMTFAYDHWTELDADLRLQTRGQVQASWRVHAQRSQLFEATRRVRNGGGRVALALEIFKLKVEDFAETSLRPAPPPRP